MGSMKHQEKMGSIFKILSEILELQQIHADCEIH